jgi:hypothetical protein
LRWGHDTVAAAEHDDEGVADAGAGEEFDGKGCGRMLLRARPAGLGARDRNEEPPTSFDPVLEAEDLAVT